MLGFGEGLGVLCTFSLLSGLLLEDIILPMHMYTLIWVLGWANMATLFYPQLQAERRNAHRGAACCALTDGIVILRQQHAQNLPGTPLDLPFFLGHAYDLRVVTTINCR